MDDSTAVESAVVKAIRARFPDAIAEASCNSGAYGHAQWRLELAERESLIPIVEFIRTEPELEFNFLVDVTCLDHYGEEPRFRAVYVLRSMKNREDLVLKVAVPEEDIWAPTMTGTFRTANWLEREAYDMFGVKFKDHPDLRRILMPDMFDDFPLRKDFPMEGKRSDREWAEWVIARAQREEG